LYRYGGNSCECHWGPGFHCTDCECALASYCQGNPFDLGWDFSRVPRDLNISDAEFSDGGAHD
jgi:hypothetical protein